MKVDGSQKSWHHKQRTDFFPLSNNTNNQTFLSLLGTDPLPLTCPPPLLIRTQPKCYNASSSIITTTLSAWRITDIDASIPQLPYARFHVEERYNIVPWGLVYFTYFDCFQCMNSHSGLNGNEKLQQVKTWWSIILWYVVWEPDMVPWKLPDASQIVWETI